MGKVKISIRKEKNSFIENELADMGPGEVTDGE